MRKLHHLLISVGLLGAVALSAAQEQPKPATLPFTAAEDIDGARSVWFSYQRAGMPYDYLPAAQFPDSPCFVPAPNNVPQIGDVAWWKEFVAIYDSRLPQPPNANYPVDLRTHDGPVAHRALEAKYGPVKWFRFIIPCQQETTK